MRAIALTSAVLLLAGLALPASGFAQSGLCDVGFEPAATCGGSAWGPPAACSNSTAGAPVACTDDQTCCPGCRFSNHCPGRRGARCVQWPFVDVNSDGCFDAADGDTALPWPEVDATCARTQATADPGCELRPDGGRRCAHAALPVWCTFYANPTAREQLLVELDTTAWGPTAGLTAPEGAKCLDATAMLHSLGTPSRATFVVRLNGDFRNYSWGAWKNHFPHTRLFITARNVVVGGYPSDDPAGMNQGTQVNWDKDVRIDATGCILLGPDDPRSNTLRMNRASAGDMVMLRARQGVLVDRSWLLTAKRGMLRLEGCPLAIGGRPRGSIQQRLSCPRCVSADGCGAGCEVEPDPRASIPEPPGRTCPADAVCQPDALCAPPG